MKKATPFEFFVRCLVIFLAIFFASCAYAQRGDGYAGWGLLARKLRADGIPDSLLKSVYNGQVIPPFDFVPFSLKPKETHEMYSGFLSQRVVNLGVECERQYSRELEGAEKVFHVEKEMVLAIIVVESHCGRMTGKELVVNRLSRVSNVTDPESLKKNFEKLKREDSSVKYQEMKERGEYLEQIFYPQLKELFEAQIRGDIDIFSLQGSIAGAFGWPQFLPLTYSKYGVDGDRDGHISLYNPADAIYSAAHFFAAHGWQEDLPERKKREILWHYNKSEPYIDTVLKLKSIFRG